MNRKIGAAVCALAAGVGATWAVAAETVVAANACSGAIPGNAIYLADQYPGISVLKPDQIPGAPNYRQVGDDPVYGTGQPTVEALGEILRGAEGPHARRVLWLNLRAEADLYINGRPYSLRDPAHPFHNLTGVSATAEQARAVEACLEKELRRGAAAKGGMVDLYGESPDGKLEDRPQRLDSVMTAEEVFKTMGDREGYRVEYRRIPVEDEKAPTAAGLQSMLDAYSSKAPNEALVLNCQAGNGRTTTALAVYYISRGLDADAAIDKVAAVQNLRESIQKQKSPERRQDYQLRYDVLKALSQRPPKTSVLPRRVPAITLLAPKFD